jgi:2-C-methyl-D-erythritol 4-phosphate cytidylyltransferase
MMNILMLMMAGSGTRFGADIPKQFVKVEGRPVFSYIVEKYNQLSCIDRIVVVTHKNWLDYVAEWKETLHADKLCTITAGGDTRSESVKNGLVAMHEYANEEDVILIHDATHPYVDEEGTLGVIEGVKKYGGATLGQCQYDTVYQMNEETHMLEKVVPRQQIVSGASPEAFRYGDIYRIYTESTQEELESMTSAGAIALAHGIQMEVVPANVLNLKITYPGDMEVFESLVHEWFDIKG